MKKVTVAAILFLAIGWSISPTNAFVPTGFLRLCTKAVGCFRDKLVGDVDMITHQDMTKRAILQVADDVLKANPNPRDRKALRGSLLSQASTKQVWSLPTMAAMMMERIKYSKMQWRTY